MDTRRVLVLSGLFAAACGGSVRPPAAPTQLGTSAWRVDGSVQAIAFRAGERELVVATDAGTLQVIDTGDGAAVLTVENLDYILGMGLRDDDTVLLAGEHDAVVDLRAGRRIGDLKTASKLPSSVLVMAVAADGSHVVGYDGEDRTLRRYELTTGAEVAALDGSQGCDAPSFAGSSVVSICENRTRAVVWDAAGHRFSVPSTWYAVVDPVRQLILASDREALVLHQLDGVLVHRWAVPCSTGAGALSPDGLLLAMVCDRKGVFVFETASGKQLGAWPALPGYTRRVAFSPSGRLLAAGGTGHTLHVWRIDGWRARDAGTGHHGVVSGMTLAASAGRLLTVSFSDRTARLWNTRTGALLRTFDDLGVDAAALDESGTAWTARRLDDGVLRIERWTERGSATRLDLAGVSRWAEPFAMAARPDGGLVLYIDGHVRTLDSRGAETWRSPELPESRFPDLRQVAITSDAEIVAIAGRHDIAVFDADRRREITRLVPVPYDILQALAVSPDHRRLAIVTSDVLRLHELPSGALVDQLDLTTDAGGYTDIEFTRNGAEVLVLSRERLFLWQPGEPPLMRPLRHAATLRWSRTDNRLYIGKTNGTVTILTGAALRAGMRPYSR